MAHAQQAPLRMETLETREMPALFAIGAGESGGPRVSAYDSNGNLAYNFFAFDAGRRDGVRVATANVVGDGNEDIIVASGNQSTPQIRVYDGGSPRGNVAPRLALEYTLSSPVLPSFFGGMQIAAGDLNRDGRAEIIISNTSGGVFALNTATGVLSQRLALTNFGTPWSVGAADLNADGISDVIIGSPNAAATGTDVAAFSGAGAAINSGFLYGLNVAGAAGRVNVAGGRLDGDGLGDVVFTVTNGVDTNVVFAHNNPVTGTAARAISVNPYGDWRGELRVGLDTRFGQPNIILGPGFGGGPRVVQLDVNGNRLAGDFFVFEDTFRGGLYVG